MKALAFDIPKTQTNAVHFQVDKGPEFYSTLHHHPEIQITFIVAGSGTLICGDHVGQFQPNDLFVVGANQAHVFRKHTTSAADSLAHSVSVFVDRNSFGAGFFDVNEARALSDFLQRSQRGLKMSSAASAIW